MGQLVVMQATGELGLVQMRCDMFVRHLLQSRLKKVGFLYDREQTTGQHTWVS